MRLYFYNSLYSVMSRVGDHAGLDEAIQINVLRACPDIIVHNQFPIGTMIHNEVLCIGACVVIDTSNALAHVTCIQNITCICVKLYTAFKFYFDVIFSNLFLEYIELSLSCLYI